MQLTVPPFSSQGVSVYFVAGDRNARSAFVLVSSNSPRRPFRAVRLTATSVMGDSSLSASALSFGNVNLTSSRSLNWTITNVGADALGILSVRITGTDVGSFKITADSGQVRGLQCTAHT